jgi:eukaryotic-like serine/threonine-protein kinase
MAVKPGDILRDKYRIDALIGRGGMGQVFAATDLDSANTQVAIKVVSRLLIDEVLMVRLHREAEAAQRIQSDYVPRVIEVSDTEDGETFLVMERLLGEPLSQRIREQGALPWPEVARVGEDVLRGLIDAHTAGIVHRDLKPSNVFLALKEGRMRAMVLDFGVCKMDGLDVERLTGTGESIGTVAYMAPEQIRGAARVDERADLYAFGVLVFEMLSGRLPHDGPSQMAILASKLENRAASLGDCSRVAIPEGTEALVMRTLSREPADRFPNAQDLLKSWRTLSKSERLVASTPPPPLLPRAGPDDVTAVGVMARVDRGRPAFGEVGGEPEDHVTERSRPLGFVRASGDSVADTEDDLADAARPARVAMAEGAPGAREPHSTQTSLTTQAGSGRRGGGKGSARAALILAACALAVGVIVIGVSFWRGPDAPTPTMSTGSIHAMASAGSEAPSAAATSELDVPPPPESGALFELPAESPESVTAGSKPKLPRPRAPRPVTPAAPRSSGPHITSQPRY